jgi:hypothetical protein
MFLFRYIPDSHYHLLFSELYAEKIWKFIKILFFHENIFFLIRKSQNTPNSIFRDNIRNLLLRAKVSESRLKIVNDSDCLVCNEKETY